LHTIAVVVVVVVVVVAVVVAVVVVVVVTMTVQARLVYLVLWLWPVRAGWLRAIQWWCAVAYAGYHFRDELHRWYQLMQLLAPI
jgi:hypothetical protein